MTTFFDLIHFKRLGQKSKNNFVRFLVQMRTRKFAFEIYWPLLKKILTVISGVDWDQLKVQSKKLRGYHILEGFVQISFDLDKYKTKINFNRNLNAVKGCLFSENFSLKSSKERCQITIMSTIHLLVKMLRIVIWPLFLEIRAKLENFLKFI